MVAAVLACRPVELLLAPCSIHCVVPDCSASALVLHTYLCVAHPKLSSSLPCCVLTCVPLPLSTPQADFKAEKISAETVVLGEDGKPMPLPPKKH